MQKALRPLAGTGVPYLIRHIYRSYSKSRAQYFAWELAQLSNDYLLEDSMQREVADRRFESILDCLVMRNGVTKTTYSNRHVNQIKRLLNDPRFVLNRNTISVLDVPSSAGQASLSSYALLCERYTIDCFVLGDLYFNLYFDEERGCVYDEERHLLQVKEKNRYWSIYRPHVGGSDHSRLVRFVLWRSDKRSERLKRMFPWDPGNTYRLLSMMHPRVQELIRDGRFEQNRLDVFTCLFERRFDLVLSFNLLQRNYFPEEQVELGIKNLGSSLKPGGVLVVGDTESYTLYQMSDKGLLRL